MPENCAAIVIAAKHHELTKVKDARGTTNTIGALRCKFNFRTDDWLHSAKTAMFCNGNAVLHPEVIEDAIAVPLDSDDECPVPYEVLKDTLPYSIGVWGVTDNGLRIVSNWLVFRAQSGCYAEGNAPAEPERTVYEEIILISKEATDAAQGVIDRANSGEFDGKSAYELAQEEGFEGTLEEWIDSLVGATGQPGKDGKDGTDGKDGYTPVKGVDYFDGQPGKDGKDGYTPVKGIDYFDGKDGAAGKDGANGKDGVDGKDGYTPIKGVDYFDGKDGVDGKDGQLTEDQIALLTKLSDWYDTEHYVAMTGTFSMSPNTTTYEMGTSKSVTFSWTFSKLPVEVTFNNEAQAAATSGSKTVTVASNTHATKTYTIYGKYKDNETVTKQLSINFRNRYYYGYVAEPAEIDGAFIKSLANNNWASAKTISFTPNCTAGTYVWYAYPKRLGAAVMWMGGFQGGFEEPLTVSVTNGSGVTEDYYLYRSTNSGIGDLSIQAK